MNLVALLLTYLFFCHPKLLMVVALVFALVLLFTYAPAGFMVLVLIVIGIFAFKFFVG